MGPLPAEDLLRMRSLVCCAHAVDPTGMCPESACTHDRRNSARRCQGDVGRRWDQPAGPARGQLPAAVNGFGQALRSVALQPHAGWIVPCPRRSVLTRWCVCTVRRMPRQSAPKCWRHTARPALTRGGWWSAIGPSSPARWAVRWAVRSSHACTNASPLTLHVDMQKIRYRRPWPSTPPPGPIRPRQCPPPLSLMAGRVGRPAGAFRRLRLPVEDSLRPGGSSSRP